MTTPALHQFVPQLNVGAIGTHILEIRRTLHELGWRGEVFANEVKPPYEREGRLVGEYDALAEPGDLLLYHVAHGSPMAQWLMARPERLLVDYHNMTPFEFFAGWDDVLAAETAYGRIQLRALARRTSFALADSAFNEQELRDSGFGRTAVVPILLDLDRLESEVDEDALACLLAAKDGGGADWLFVGRVAPNKTQHDVVKAFAAYRRAYDPRARLHLVGGPSPASYLRAVAKFADHLGLADAVELTGPVTGGEIAAHYRAADVFVCLSEHEGFCVPLLEAWHHRVPVVALAATAVPETLGDAGILLDEKRPTLVAAAVHRVLSDAALRDALVAAGTARLDQFSLHRSRARLVEALAQVEAEVGG